MVQEMIQHEEHITPPSGMAERYRRVGTLRGRLRGLRTSCGPGPRHAWPWDGEDLRRQDIEYHNAVIEYPAAFVIIGGVPVRGPDKLGSGAGDGMAGPSYLPAFSGPHMGSGPIRVRWWAVSVSADTCRSCLRRDQLQRMEREALSDVCGLWSQQLCLRHRACPSLG
jgi:hypothetical protein